MNGIPDIFLWFIFAVMVVVALLLVAGQRTDRYADERARRARESALPRDGDVRRRAAP